MAVKYLLVLLVVGIGLWSLLTRLRGPRRGGSAGDKPAGSTPVAMVQCAHCGLHLPAADALPEGAQLYCSDAHRQLGPAQPPRE